MIIKVRRLLILGINHPAILIGFFTAEMIIAGILYAHFEGKTVFDGVWWAIVTACTVGYGDQFPVTSMGRIVGIAIMLLNIFVIAPCIVAFVISKVLENRDKWTHEEQEKLKEQLALSAENERVLMSRLETASQQLETAIERLGVLYTEVDGVEEADAADVQRDGEVAEMLAEVLRRLPQTTPGSS